MAQGVSAAFLRDGDDLDAGAGERALFELKFPADVADQVDAQLARFGLELAPAADQEAA
jgi:hypothetical protein